MSECPNCYNNCGGAPVSDKCVKYTGPDIDFLDIETGDSLSMLEAALIEKLEIALDGTGITFEDFTTCTAITDAIEGEENLSTILQAISDVICQMKIDIAALDTDIDPPLSISAPCLTLEANPTRDQVLQAIATKLCAINTTVSTISSNYVTTATLCSLVQDCIGEDENANQEFAKMAKYVAVPYHGPLSVFDSQGRGLSSAGYDRVYICNGQTVGTFTTPDYRGRSPLGVNQGIPGGVMDAAVDPSLPANTGYNFVVGTKKGTFTDTLTIANLPNHSHVNPTIAFPINIPGQRGGDNSDHNNVTAFAGGDKSPSETVFNFTMTLNTALPTYSSSAIGSSTAHTITQPVIGAVFIMYVPA